MHRLSIRLLLAVTLVATFQAGAGPMALAQPSRETITVRAARVLDGKGARSRPPLSKSRRAGSSGWISGPAR